LKSAETVMPEFVADDGVRLHYVTRGRGPATVIYLHGMGGHGRLWGGLWQELGLRHYRHVALDCRGHGRSHREACTFTNRRLARDVLNLADALGIERFVVVGHSFGGKVALQLAALAPGRVHGLALLGAVGPGKVPLERKAVRAMLRQIHDLTFLCATLRNWYTVWSPAVHRWLASMSETPAWTVHRVCEIALWTDLPSSCFHLSTASLLVCGRHDPVYGPAYQKRSVRPALPQARLVTVDCGHGMMLERPAEIAAHLARFLRGKI
jgi:pimeloyl-ACP methyl ester carboxylesterase